MTVDDESADLDRADGRASDDVDSRIKLFTEWKRDYGIEFLQTARAIHMDGRRDVTSGKDALIGAMQAQPPGDWSGQFGLAIL